MGRVFAVGEMETLRDPDTGEILDQSVETVATIQVEKVKEKIAICKIVKGGEVEKGMSVMPSGN